MEGLGDGSDPPCQVCLVGLESRAKTSYARVLDLELVELPTRYLAQLGKNLLSLVSFVPLDEKAATWYRGGSGALRPCLVWQLLMTTD